MRAEKQFGLFKRNVVRKFVEGTEEDAKKWQSPGDWADWSLKRIRDNKMEMYGIWVVFFLHHWEIEMMQEWTTSDQCLLETAKSKKMSFFWKESCKFPHLEFKVLDIARRTFYEIRRITGFPSYRGRIDLIVKWKRL